MPVDHCPQAYGLVLTHKRGWKIVYSGDTRPCLALIKAGKSFARVGGGTRAEEMYCTLELGGLLPSKATSFLGAGQFTIALAANHPEI